MFKSNGIAFVAIAVTGAVGTTLSSPLAIPVSEPEPLEDEQVVIVYSATDEDAQVLVSGGSELPIKRICVKSPCGDKVADSKFKDAGSIGQADFQFETPEPTLEEITDAFPEGVYRFHGRATDGTRLFGSFELSHELLAAPELVYPMEGDVDVPLSELVVRWNAIENAEAIRLEIENEEEETALKVDLPGEATSFEVPDGWLTPDTLFVLDIKAIAENGNITVSDVEFTTVGSG